MTQLSSLSTDAPPPHIRVEPFLRWAGGKRWLVPHLLQIVPRDASYVEPFLGGGSVFFGLSSRKSLLADSNDHLVNVYHAVRSNAEELIDRLLQWPNNEKNYYRVRETQFRTSLDRAAQFLFLNKTCWNGLYRVNRQGRFNVPYGGRPDRPVVNPDGLRAAARALREAELRTGDFAQHLTETDEHHVVYLDPPYATKDERSFLRYNPRTFSWNDQRRLANEAMAAAGRGAFVIVSNAYSRDIINLYDRFCHIPVSRKQLLAANSQHRSSITEILLVSSREAFERLNGLGLST